MGTTGEKIARLVAPNANLVGAKTYKEAYNLLVNRQVDAVLGDDCILAGYVNKDLKIFFFVALSPFLVLISNLQVIILKIV